jgi:hypothetical protein
MSAESLPETPASPTQGSGTIQNPAGGSGGNSALVLGDGGLHPGKGNMALVRRAIRDGWPIPAEVRQSVVTQLAGVVAGSEDERNKIAASKVLVSASAVNATLERLDQADDHVKRPQVHAHAHFSQPTDQDRIAAIFERFHVQPPEQLPVTEEAMQSELTERVRERVAGLAASLGVPLDQPEQPLDNQQ